MNKKVLIRQVAKETGVNVSEVSKVVNATLLTISEELCERSGQVQLLGFGTFYAIERPEKVGRHPKTGETLRIPPAMVVRFKAGSRMQRGLEEMTVERQLSDMGTRAVFLQ